MGKKRKGKQSPDMAATDINQSDFAADFDDDEEYPWTEEDEAEQLAVEKEWTWGKYEEAYSRRMHRELQAKLTPAVSEGIKSVIDDCKARIAADPDSAEACDIKRATISKIAQEHGFELHEGEMPATKPNSLCFKCSVGQKSYYSDFMDKDTFIQSYAEVYDVLCKKNGDSPISPRCTDDNGKIIMTDYEGECCEDPWYYNRIDLIREREFRSWKIDDPEGRSIVKDVKNKYKTMVDDLKSRYDRDQLTKDEIKACDDMVMEDLYGNNEY